jgi:hypothetical protein
VHFSRRGAIQSRVAKVLNAAHRQPPRSTNCRKQHLRGAAPQATQGHALPLAPAARATKHLLFFAPRTRTGIRFKRLFEFLNLIQIREPKLNLFIRSELLRFVRRLHSYYGGVRLLVPVHHRIRLLVFPMRTVPLTRPDGQTRDLPASGAILLHVMWPSTPAGRQHLA